jgi:hypothetical protein
MARLLRVAIFMACVFSAGSAFATVVPGGTCPASAPVTGKNCYFIAASGSDTNNGTSETTPWLHAPGMPNCTSTCAGVSPTAGNGFIFRGGDTWHFGKSSASPYTGGTWNLTNTAGNPSTCVYEGTQTGCIYYGVDTTWYNSSNCAAWCRPILNGDNPTSATTVSSCAYQIGSSNQMVYQGAGSGYYNILDNFEMLGLCTSSATGGNTNANVYVQDGGSGITAQGVLFQTNLYIHGWTATTTAGTGSEALACVIFSGGNQSLHVMDRIVVDGSDSNPGVCAWATFPSFYHFRDSIIRYATQGVGQWCHDIHDSIFEHFYAPNVPTHGNILECNDDSPGNAPGQPQNTPNVFYNNVVRHDDPSFVSGGEVHLWFCPEGVPEYWFNNLMYDVGSGNDWDYAGAPTYSCTNTGGQYMFNNTLVDVVQTCYISTVSHGGKYLTISNEHLINTPLDTGTTACTGYNSATNVAMTDAAAITQGYLLSSGGTANADTCANDGTTPCTAILSTDSTITAGTNQQGYCTALASYTSEPAIGTDAANACKYGTTDGCSYNTMSHTMICPSAWQAVKRPATTAWDSGAYQFSSVSPPTNGAATVSGP